TKSDLEDLVQKGFERIKKFTWENTANTTLATINRLNSCDIKKSSLKKRIAFFTPLPPIKSGISDYSVELLNKLVNHFSIDVYIDKGYTPNAYLDKNINIYKHNK
ncbi:hypothetical protein D7X33_44910, partial [Butyricicoccus sp. 1XD8-22]